MARATTIRTCVCCGRSFEVRQNEVNRGWGLYCSKGCCTTARNRSLSVLESSSAEKSRANGLINMRVRRGQIEKPVACELCGKVAKLDGHHDDYDKPGTVLWLCRSCHMKRHHTNASKTLQVQTV